MARLFDWLNDSQRVEKIYNARLNAEFDNLFDSVRERLAANRTYYVRSDGSDANDGLTNTAAGAFLTLEQAAFNAINNIDINSTQVTIQVAAGTYTGCHVDGVLLLGWFGTLTFLGDATTPGNVVIDCSAQPGFGVSGGAVVRISGFKFTGNQSHLYVHGEQSGLGGTVYIDGKCEFAATTSTDGCIKCAEGGNVFIRTDYTISGGQFAHWSANMGGRIMIRGSRTITLTGTPAFSSSFAEARFGGVIRCAGATFSGGATGKRFIVSDMAVVYIGSTGGLSFLPGDLEGTRTNNGIYAADDNLANDWTVCRKQSDETRSSNDTLTNDGVLQFRMVASTKYAIRIKAWFDTTAAADFKFALTGPAAPTLVRLFRIHFDPTNLTTSIVASEVAYTTSTAVAAGAGTTGGYVSFDIVVHNGANTGTFAFQWAQNTSDASNTIVRAGSYLEFGPTA